MVVRSMAGSPKILISMGTGLPVVMLGLVYLVSAVPFVRVSLLAVLQSSMRSSLKFGHSSISATTTTEQVAIVGLLTALIATLLVHITAKTQRLKWGHSWLCRLRPQ